MRKISFAQISIALVNKIFNWRFRIAGWTKKSKIAKKIISTKDTISKIPQFHIFELNIITNKNLINIKYLTYSFFSIISIKKSKKGEKNGRK